MYADGINDETYQEMARFHCTVASFKGARYGVERIE